MAVTPTSTAAFTPTAQSGFAPPMPTPQPTPMPTPQPPPLLAIKSQPLDRWVAGENGQRFSCKKLGYLGAIAGAAISILNPSHTRFIGKAIGGFLAGAGIAWGANRINGLS